MQAGYVIVTAAYNEADHLAATVASVVRQTLPPARWVIVDDGSTDETPTLLSAWAWQYPFLLSLRRERDRTQSYFASNVHALMAGVRHLAHERYEFLAVLDADITLPDDYYEQILARFKADPKLGVASGIYENLVAGRLERVLHDRRSASKAIQVFRRECFEALGGYVPLPHGGEDTCACIMARMNGWKSWSFPELKAVHHRPTGVGNAGGLLRARFLQGLGEWGLSTHPVFMVAKSLRRCALERPRIVGGVLRLSGYAYGCLRREPRWMPPAAARYVRREQLGRLFCFNRIPRRHRHAAQMP